jgi:hypothetical protein
MSKVATYNREAAIQAIVEDDEVCPADLFCELAERMDLIESDTYSVEFGRNFLGTFFYAVDLVNGEE